jgi:hypothetical protein
VKRSFFPSQGAAIASAFLIAPLGSAIWGGAWSLFAGGGDAFGPVGFMIMFYLYSLPLGIILGLPALFFLAKRKRLVWWTVASLGVLAGLSISLVLHLPIPLFAPIGPAWASIFYLVWKSGPEPADYVAVNWVRGFIGVES